MEAARRRAPSEGLSAFLVEHDACGAGFDVSHPAGLGNGSLRIVCRGCGAGFDYAPGIVEIEREIELEPVGATVTPLPVPPREPATAEPGPPPRRPGPTLPRERIVTVALLLFALAALVFAVIRLSQGGDDDTQPAREAPSVSAKPAPAPAPAPATTEAPQPAPAKVKAGSDVRVHTTLFSLVVPASWTSRGSGAATVYSPTGVAPSASVEVFYERNPTIDRGEMVAATAQLLGSRAGGAVGSPRYLRSGDDPAFELEANGPRGTQTALGVLAGPYRYLVIANAADRVSAANRAALRRALAGFRAS